MKTIMLIENNGQGEDGKVQVDFDDKLSWEYLFKVYWVYLKGKLSLTLNELMEAKNPWKETCTISSSLPSNGVHNKAIELRSITSPTSVHNVEENESKRRKVDEQINIPLPPEETVHMEKPDNAKSEGVAVVECKDWATKELLDFVAHMKNGNTSELSRFDVQALMMEYINKNNLWDAKKKTQIICDSRLNSLFGKPRIGHIQILKLLDHHLLVKENLIKENLVKENLRKTRVKRSAVPEDADWTSDNVSTIGKDKKRRNLGKDKEDALQNKLDDFAAVDAYNMNLIYLRRDLMENLLEESENFHCKVVGSIVKIRILGSDLKHDMYRLVQVVGTSKVDVPYKIGNKSTDVMLEVLNLDKKETISIDTISDQDFSEEECRRLQQSIRCGLVNHFTVGEIQEKAVALQSLKLNDWMEKEILRLTHLRDTTSGKKNKKGYRECVEKLELLKTPDERERRLQQIPVVHSDPKMNPHYESDDTEEYFNKEHGDHMESKYSGVSSKSSRSPIKRAGRSNDADNWSQKDEKLSMKGGSTKETVSIQVEKVALASALEHSQQEVDFKGSTVTKLDQQATIRSPVSNNSPETIASSPNDSVWHYLDPNGKVQGPFSLIQLQRWSTTGYFPVDMRIWANHKDKSLLLNDVLRDQFSNYENATLINKVSNQVEGHNVCRAAPSSLVAATQYAEEKLADNNGSSGQSFGQNWSANKTLNSSPLNEPTVHLNPVSGADIRHAPAAVIDLPGPSPKKMVDEKEKILLVQDSGNPPSWSSASSLVVGGGAKVPVSNEWDGGSFPAKREQWVDSGIVSVSSFKTPEVAADHVATPTSNIDHNVNQSQPAGNDFTTWHGMGEMIEFSTLAEESVSDLLAEVDAMESQHGLPSPTSRRNSFVDDLFNGSFDEFSPTPDQGTRSDGFSSSGDIQLPCQTTNPATTTTTTATTDEHLVGFDFMKTSNGVQQHSFITPDVAVSGIPHRTNSESLGFKWTDMERAPQGMIDINASAKAEGDEGEMETKIGEVEAEENGNYNFHQSLAQSDTRHSHGGSETSHGGGGGGIVQNPEQMLETKSGEPMQAPKSFGIGAKLVSRVAQIKGLEGTTNHRREDMEEDGEFIKPEEPQQQKQLPPPPPPPPLTLGLDPFDPSNLQSDTTQGKSNHTGRPGEGRSGNIGWDLNPNTDPNSTSNPNPSPNQRRSGSERFNSSSNSPRERSHHVEEPGYTRSSRSSSNKQSTLGSGNGNVGWDLNPNPNATSNPNPRRSGGERYNSNSKSPRERSHHVDEPGYSRTSRSYWNKQSSLGTGSGGGYSKPPSKGQRCRYYESGRCKKGASCKYLHTPK